MRVIMAEFKEESEESVRVMRQHREISDFLKKRLPKMSETPGPEAQEEIKTFASSLRKHHEKEEKIPFPLAIRAHQRAKARKEKLSVSIKDGFD